MKRRNKMAVGICTLVTCGIIAGCGAKVEKEVVKEVKEETLVEAIATESAEPAVTASAEISAAETAGVEALTEYAETEGDPEGSGSVQVSYEGDNILLSTIKQGKVGQIQYDSTTGGVVSDLGYQITFEDFAQAAYTGTEKVSDYYEMQLDLDPEIYPVVSMEIAHYDKIEVKTEEGTDGNLNNRTIENKDGKSIATVSFGSEALKEELAVGRGNYLADHYTEWTGNKWSDPMADTWIIEDGKGGNYLIRYTYFVEAEEGWGTRFRDALLSFEITP